MATYGNFVHFRDHCIRSSGRHVAHSGSADPQAMVSTVLHITPLVPGFLHLPGFPRWPEGVSVHRRRHLSLLRGPIHSNGAVTP
jgi:hypothetical protein